MRDMYGESYRTTSDPEVVTEDETRMIALGISQPTIEAPQGATGNRVLLSSLLLLLIGP